MMRVGVLASGSGSNFQAIAEGLRGSSAAQLAVVVSNVPQAGVLQRAAALGVEALVLDHRQEPSRPTFDLRLVELLRARDVELVCLAGYMRLVTPVFLSAFPNRVLNVHPALLPAFPGLHAVRQALEYGAKVSGCTVHLVDEGTDTGPIVAQAAVPIVAGDDEASLAAKIHVEEHRLYPAVVRAFAEGRVTVQGRRVWVEGSL